MTVSREAFSPAEEKAKKGGTAKYVSPFAETCSPERTVLAKGFSVL
jgi:hypothetical protein